MNSNGCIVENCNEMPAFNTEQGLICHDHWHEVVNNPEKYPKKQIDLSSIKLGDKWNY